MSGPEIIHDLNRIVHPETKTVIVGGGINGLAIGTQLQDQNLGQVEIFDRTGANATIASGAQVFPYVNGDNPFLYDEEKELLTYDLAYLPAILQHFSESFDNYLDMAHIPDSGITQSLMLELASEKNDMPREMKYLMNSRIRFMEHEHGLQDFGFTRYYEMQSFAVDALAHFKFLKKRFEDQGGIWHGKTHVSKQAVQTFDQGVIVIAAGHREDELRDPHPFPAQKHLGMSAIYRTTESLPQNPVIGFDDYLIRTHDDQLGLTVGGFVLDAHYRGISSSNRKLVEADTDRLAQDCLEQVADSLGPWQGLPLNLLRRVTPNIRFGVRSLGTFGPTVEQDRDRPNQVWVSGAGHVGISLAHGLKMEAADVVREIQEVFTKGMPHPQKLLGATGNFGYPRELPMSIRYRQRNPSIDLGVFQDKVESIHDTMAAITIKRAMEA